MAFRFMGIGLVGKRVGRLEGVSKRPTFNRAEWGDLIPSAPVKTSRPAPVLYTVQLPVEFQSVVSWKTRVRKCSTEQNSLAFRSSGCLYQTVLLATLVTTYSAG